MTCGSEWPHAVTNIPGYFNKFDFISRSVMTFFNNFIFYSKHVFMCPLNKPINPHLSALPTSILTIKLNF